MSEAVPAAVRTELPMNDAVWGCVSELFVGHTPGPWAWRYCVGGLPELVHPGHGLLLVLDAVRRGTHRATVRFATRTPSDRGGLMERAEKYFLPPGTSVPDYQTPRNPDMRLVAAAPMLLAEVLRLRARIADLEASIGSNTSAT